jgi:hypothetical protein
MKKDAPPKKPTTVKQLERLVVRLEVRLGRQVIALAETNCSLIQAREALQAARLGRTALTAKDEPGN